MCHRKSLSTNIQNLTLFERRRRKKEVAHISFCGEIWIRIRVFCSDCIAGQFLGHEGPLKSNVSITEVGTKGAMQKNGLTSTFGANSFDSFWNRSSSSGDNEFILGMVNGTRRQTDLPVGGEPELSSKKQPRERQEHTAVNS